MPITATFPKPLRPDTTRADGPIMDSVGGAGINDLTALNQKMNGLLAYPNQLDMEATSFGPWLTPEAVGVTATPLFRPVVLLDGANRNLEWRFIADDCVMTVNMRGDGGGLWTKSVTHTTAMESQVITFTPAEVASLTVTDYVYFEIFFSKRLTGSNSKLWSAYQQQGIGGMSTAGKDNGFVATYDEVFYGGDKILDSYLLNRLGSNGDALLKCNANRCGRMWQAYDPDEQSSTNAGSRHVIGGLVWRLDGPYYFHAGAYEDSARFVVSGHTDGGTVNTYMLSRTPDADGASALPKVSAGKVWAGLSVDTWIGEVPLKPDSLNEIWVAVKCTKSAVPDSELSRTNIGKGHLVDGRLSTAFYTPKASGAFAGFLPDKEALHFERQDKPDGVNNRSEHNLGVWDYTTGIGVYTPPWSEGTPEDIASGTGAATAQTELKIGSYETDNLRMNSIQILGVPSVPEIRFFPEEFASASKTMALYSLVENVANKNNSQLGARSLGAEHMKKSRDQWMPTQTGSSLYRNGAWSVCSPDAALGTKWTPAGGWPCAWGTTQMPLNHASEPPVGIQPELPRGAWAQGMFILAKKADNQLEVPPLINASFRLAFISRTTLQNLGHGDGTIGPYIGGETLDVVGETVVKQVMDSQVVQSQHRRGHSTTMFDLEALISWIKTKSVDNSVNCEPGWWSQTSRLNSLPWIETPRMWIDLRNITTAMLPGFYVMQVDVPGFWTIMTGAILKFGPNETFS